MKLVIISGCVIGGGKTAEPGQIIDTGDIEVQSDRVAYSLIANSRALAMRKFDKGGNDIGANPEAEQFLRDFKFQQEAVAAAPAVITDGSEDETPVVKGKKK